MASKHLEKFKFTLVKKVTRSGRPGNPPRLLTPPINPPKRVTSPTKGLPRLYVNGPLNDLYTVNWILPAL